ncbi:hypothetical protein CLU79DRAFT_775948 [Phycomyces nitens]|nr:hypothetical protein CLU79DRAFT_775948 [Phycomyces nitens]
MAHPFYCPPSKPNNLEALWPMQYDQSIQKDLYTSLPPALSPKLCFPTQCPQSFYNTPEGVPICYDDGQLGMINYPYYITTPTLDYSSENNVLQDDNFSIATAPELDVFPQHPFGARRYQSMPDISLAQTQDLWTPQSSFSTKTDDSQNMFVSLYAPQTIQDARLPNPNEKRHICPVCFHRSRRRHNLLEHMQTHNPNRPRSFICPSCHRGFARKYDMKRHEKIHFR